MQKWAIGVDLGGTKIEVAIVSNKGELVDRSRIATDSGHSADKITDDIVTTITELCAKHTTIAIAAIGVGVAGQIEKESGKVIYAPNLEWRNVDLQQQLTNKLKKPVTVINDVKAAAWGEWQHGAGVDCDNLVCLFIGTGIGGAIVCNGKMLDGCNNTAGEIGHMTLQLNGPVCHCGNKGCFEALAGGWAITRAAQAAIKANATAGAAMLQIAGGDITKVTGKTVTEAAQKGDALANKLTDDLTTALTAGIVSAINLIGPCKVILGGGVIEGMPELTERISKQMKGMALKAAIEKVALLPAKLHYDSGVIGAATYALHKTNK